MDAGSAAQPLSSAASPAVAAAAGVFVRRSTSRHACLWSPTGLWLGAERAVLGAGVSEKGGPIAALTFAGWCFFPVGGWSGAGLNRLGDDYFGNPP